MRMRVFTAMVLGIFVSLSVEAEGDAAPGARTWALRDGRNVEAEFRGVENGDVYLDVGGRVARTPGKNLSPEDIAYVKRILVGKEMLLTGKTAEDAVSQVTMKKSVERAVNKNGIQMKVSLAGGKTYPVASQEDVYLTLNVQGQAVRVLKTDTDFETRAKDCGKAAEEARALLPQMQAFAETRRQGGAPGAGAPASSGTPSAGPGGALPDHLREIDNGGVLLKRIPPVVGGGMFQSLLRAIAQASPGATLSGLDGIPPPNPLNGSIFCDNLKEVQRRVKQVYGMTLREELSLVEKKDLDRLEKSYNTAAKRLGKPELFFFLFNNGRMRTYRPLGTYLGATDPDALREARGTNRPELDRFYKAVKAGIDEGRPLLWCAGGSVLGTQTESMYLVVGYHPDGIVYYTSPGDDAPKQIPLEDAVCSSTGLLSVKP